MNTLQTKAKAAIATILIAVAGLSAPLPVRADDSSLAEQIVDALAKRYGDHAGYRANHAKGVLTEGTFKPSAEGVLLTTSPIYAGATLPVTVRFSDASGLPAVKDAAAVANPHGISIKFRLPDGSESDIVANAYRYFVVATPEDFRDLQLAAAASPPGAPRPTKLEEFMQAHPSVARANAALATPDSFADEEYNGVDAFIFTNKAGRKQAFRYIIAPERIVHLSKEDAARVSHDFLMEELPLRLKAGPVTFHIKAQLASPGDSTKDPTQAWPQDRKVVDLGVLAIDRFVADSTEQQKQLLFLPGNLTAGIEPSDDPLIAARDNAYPISYARRNQ
jgi:catalase